MLKHARLSPSNHRWPYCPGSIREESKYPDISSEAAIDGTGSHLLLEMCITNNVSAEHYIDQYIGTNHPQKLTGWLADQERCKRVQVCLDYIERRKKELQKKYLVDCEIIIESESKSNPGQYFNRNDWWGTCDITIKVILKESGLTAFLEIIDYKDGRGYVSEKWNSQLVSYLFGKIIEIGEIEPGALIPYTGMRMTIIQPKTDTPIRYMCSTNPDDNLNRESLMFEIKRLSVCAKDTDNPEAVLIFGKHCEWCKHNSKRGGSCTAEIEKSTEVIESITNDISILNHENLIESMIKALSDIKSITPENLSKILDSEAGFNAVFQKVKEEIIDRLNMGEEIPGYAMVPGKAKKVWNFDFDTIAKKLKSKRLKKDQIFPSTLITPAAILKHPDLTDIQKQKIKEDLISEVTGKNVLKKVAYKKEKNIDEMFKTVPDKKTVSFL